MMVALVEAERKRHAAAIPGMERKAMAAADADSKALLFESFSILFLFLHLISSSYYSFLLISFNFFPFFLLQAWHEYVEQAERSYFKLIKEAERMEARAMAKAERETRKAEEERLGHEMF